FVDCKFAAGPEPLTDHKGCENVKQPSPERSASRQQCPCLREANAVYGVGIFDGTAWALSSRIARVYAVICNGITISALNGFHRCIGATTAGCWPAGRACDPRSGRWPRRR
ncbi:hypothetical protein BCSJ1_26318, partial [Bacillus cereus SJ1]